MSLTNKKYKLISILSILTILFTFYPNTSFASESFNDISNHWAKDQIENWIDSGYIKGYPDATFKPNNNITRAEFITIVNNAYGYTEKVDINYKDVAEGDWYNDAVAIAKAAGYIAGYPDDTMKPNNPISREESAVIIARINELTGDEAAADQFKDVADIPSWSKGAIGAGVKANIFTGYPDGSFKGNHFILRCESVVALSKAKEYKEAPISVTKTITNISTTGFNLALSPIALMLTQDSITLTQGGSNITIEAITTEDNGETYQIKTTLEEGQTYILSIFMEGYSFGEDSTIFVLTAEEAAQAVANAVNLQITALPTVDELALSDMSAVNEAKEAFDALTSNQKSLISTENIDKLSDLVAKMNELSNIANQEAVSFVTDKIINLPDLQELILNDATAVNDAEAAYEALTEAQKNLINSEIQTKLTNSIAKINTLQATADEKGDI